MPDVLRLRPAPARLPQFTAGAALGRHRGYVVTRSTVATTEVVELQQGRRTTLPGRRDPALGIVPPTSCACPCCIAHDCGPFGLWTCSQCC